MGNGDDDTLGARHNNLNDGVYSSDRYMDDDDNAGDLADDELHRESTLDFFNDTGLSNSPIGNDVGGGFDDKPMMVRNVDHLMQSGAMKYIDNDLLREVVQTIRSTVKDHDNLDQPGSCAGSESQDGQENLQPGHRRLSAVQNSAGRKPMLYTKRRSLEGALTSRLTGPNQLGTMAGRASDLTEGEELQFMA